MNLVHYGPENGGITLTDFGGGREDNFLRAGFLRALGDNPFFPPGTSSGVLSLGANDGLAPVAPAPVVVADESNTQAAALASMDDSDEGGIPVQTLGGGSAGVGSAAPVVAETKPTISPLIVGILSLGAYFI